LLESTYSDIHSLLNALSVSYQIFTRDRVSKIRQSWNATGMWDKPPLCFPYKSTPLQCELHPLHWNCSTVFTKTFKVSQNCSTYHHRDFQIVTISFWSFTRSFFRCFTKIVSPSLKLSKFYKNCSTSIKIFK
jgi:hypothetical protein